MTKTRIANKRYAQKRQRSTGGGSWLLVAVGFIVVLFGLALVMRGEGCAGQAERRAVTKKIVEALDRTNRADRALSAGNYGDARQYVKHVQSTLTEALGEMQEKTYVE